MTGGWNGSEYLASAELYEPATGTFKRMGVMTSARRGAAEALLPNGQVLLAGGFSTDSTVLASADLYDPQDVAPGFPSCIYACPVHILAAGTPIAPIMPMSAGASIWTISPALPSGLQLNTDNGVITGTHLSASQTQSFQITASNGTNSGSALVWITVLP